MKRYACLFIASFVLISCSIPLTYVRYTMYSPLTETTLNKVLRYSDDKIALEFYFQGDRIGLRLENHTERPIEALWDSAAIISPSGETKAVTHKDGAPLRIHPGTHTEDFIYPSDHFVVYTSERTYYEPKTKKEIFSIPVKESRIKYLFPWSYMYSSSDHAGSKFEVHLPMLIGEVRKDYRFRFMVDHVVKKLVLIPAPKS